MHTIGSTVFSCVASRNKRTGELSPEPIGDLEPGLIFCFLNSDFGGAEPHGPPRASAATEEVHCGTSATAHITGTQRAISSTPYICTSPSKNYFPTIRPIELPVFSCAASRNKRTHRVFCRLCLPQITGLSLPYFELNPAVRRTARAGRLPLGRPATRRSRVESCRSSRAPGPKKLSPIHRPICLVRPAAASGLHDSSNRKHSHPVFRFRSARSRGGPKAQRAGPAALRAARTPPPLIRRHSSSARPPTRR